MNGTSHFVPLPLGALRLIFFRSCRCRIRHRRAVTRAVYLLPVSPEVLIVPDLRHIGRLPEDLRLLTVQG
jgi:hypothetical protein